MGHITFFPSSEIPSDIQEKQYQALQDKILTLVILTEIFQPHR